MSDRFEISNHLLKAVISVCEEKDLIVETISIDWINISQVDLDPKYLMRGVVVETIDREGCQERVNINLGGVEWLSYLAFYNFLIKRLGGGTNERS